MAKSEIVTCSFKMNRDLYNQYKSIVVKNGKNVKEDIINYMKNVITSDIPNDETLEALKEVELMKSNPDLGKSYMDANEMMEELLG